MAELVVPGPAWIPSFLKALAETRNVRETCRSGGFPKSAAYKLRDRNKVFAEAWNAALRGELPDTIRSGGEERLTAPSAPRGWEKPFLAKLAETSNVRAASKEANIPLSTVYDKRRNESAFAKKWEGALYDGYTSLEMELLGYLRDPDPGYKMDVANALRLLSAHRDTVAREKARRGKRDKEAVLASLNAKLDKMRERRAAARRMLEEEGAVHPMPDEGAR